MTRTASATYEIEEANLPDKRRHMVKLTVAAEFKGAKHYDLDACEFVPLDTEVEILIDPSEFLDFIPLRDIAESAKNGNLLATYNTEDDTARASIVASLGAIDRYDVDDALDEIRYLLEQGRTDDALLFLDRWQNPIFKSTEAAKAATEQQLKR